MQQQAQLRDVDTVSWMSSMHTEARAELCRIRRLVEYSKRHNKKVANTSCRHPRPMTMRDQSTREVPGGAKPKRAARRVGATGLAKDCPRDADTVELLFLWVKGAQSAVFYMQMGIEALKARRLRLLYEPRPSS